MSNTQARQQLEEMRTVLEQRIAAIHRDRSSERSRDSEERVTESENDEALDEIDVQSRAELDQVLHALRKIENDSYGVCDRCGEAISEQRLQAVPFAASCIDCAEAD